MSTSFPPPDFNSTLDKLTEESALFANENFYLAFSARDMASMSALWSESHACLCVHPGWRLLRGREDVLGSWRSILGNVAQPGIDFHDAQVVLADGTALVTCYELIGDGVCLATNGFVLEDGRVRMLLHHSGMCAEPPDDLLRR
ncbi:MAG: nuclear transport factor 2 family protein [Pseudomonadaceae bacterium]|nr:nuclear transport factor 2 family protein [Pseudomonadaceae bacterium]